MLSAYNTNTQTYYVFVNDPKIIGVCPDKRSKKNLLVLIFELTSLVQVLGIF
jgi:hypothetical protein